MRVSNLYQRSLMPLLLILLAMPILPGAVTAASAVGGNRIAASYAPPANMPLPPQPVQRTTFFAPVSGVLRLLVILAYTSDVNYTLTPNQIRQEFFGSQGNTVANYYKEISYGAVTLQGDVAGWYRLDNPMAYYGKDCQTIINDPSCSGSPTSWWFARDAVAAAGHSINYTNYDYFIFVHAGIGQESNQQDKNALWAITYVSGISLTVWDKTVTTFSIMPELESGGASPIGVYCHEFSHQFGLPDLYNTLTGETNLGPWSLEDRGLWNGQPAGTSPAEMEAWSRMKMGFLSSSLVAVATAGRISNYTLQPLETASNGIHVIRVPISGVSPQAQYYLVEARQRVDFDKALPSSGVLITYVNELDQYKEVTVINSHPKSSDLTNATWTVGQTFTDQPNGIQISIVRKVGDAFSVVVNRAGPIAYLAVTKISTQPSPVKPNSTVSIKATIINQGLAAASHVPVQVLVDSKLLQTSNVTLDAGQSTYVSATWKAKAGSHQIKVLVDPGNTIANVIKSNSITAANLIVGPTVIISIPLAIGAKQAKAWVTINNVTYYTNQSQVMAAVLPGKVAVKIQPLVQSSNDTRQIFMGWSDGNHDNPRNLSVSSNTVNASLTALYQTQYLLTVFRNSGVTTSGGWFDANKTVTITATSPSNVTVQKSRLVFTHWSGGLDSSSTTINLTVSKPLTVTANWKTQYYVNVVSPLGTVSGAGWYDPGATATISIVSPVQGDNSSRRIFVGWNGINNGAEARKTVVVNAPALFLAYWKTQYRVTVISPYGNPTGSGWYDEGSTVSISVQPEVNYGNGTRRLFLGWLGDEAATDTSFRLTVDRAKVLMAHWTLQYQESFGVEGLSNSTRLVLTLDGNTYGISVGHPYKGWFDKGQTINVAINQTIPTGFIPLRFEGWRLSDGTQLTGSLTVNKPMDYKAVYKPEIPFLGALQSLGGLQSSLIEYIIFGFIAVALIAGVVYGLRVRRHE